MGDRKRKCSAGFLKSLQLFGFRQQLPVSLEPNNRSEEGGWDEAKLVAMGQYHVVA